MALLVLTHGLGADAGFWGTTVETLATDQRLSEFRVKPWGYHSGTAPEVRGLRRASNIVTKRRKQSIEFLGERLWSNLRTWGAEDEEIILIGHSMGGLVTAAALRAGHRNGDPRDKALLDAITGVVCVATPFAGAKAAAALSRVYKPIGGNIHVNELRPNSPARQKIVSGFINTWVRKSGAQLHLFQAADDEVVMTAEVTDPFKDKEYLLDVLEGSHSSCIRDLQPGDDNLEKLLWAIHNVRDLSSTSDPSRANRPGSTHCSGYWLARARGCARDGLVTQAEIAFSRAIVGDDLGALHEFAKFLTRSGRYEEAYAVNTRMIALPAWLEDESIDAQTERAKVMANMGVIRRSQGLLSKSESHLREAVSTVLNLSGNNARLAEAYCRDNLGHTLRKQGRIDDATEEFEGALALREDVGLLSEIARSCNNLARVMESTGRLKDGLAFAERVIAIVEGDDDEKLTLATAYTCLGELKYHQGHFVEAERALRQGLAINEELQNRLGEAISNGQLSRVYLAQDRLADAESSAKRCLEINLALSNDARAETARERLASIRRTRQNTES